MSILKPRENQIARCQADGVMQETTWPKFLAWAADRGLAHVIVMAERPGGMEFGKDLEGRYYPSDTERGQFLHVHAAIWKGMSWLIESIPAADRLNAELLAREFGFILRHTVPIATVSANGQVAALASLNIAKAAPDWVWFPLKLPNVYTLESHPDPAVLAASKQRTAAWG
jgi:hypothetical protein